MSGTEQTAIIIGAGPAGLTAALEMLRRSAIRPVVLEASDRIGGISCTIRYKGNRIDIGGHRFFSKSDRVMDWWMSLMPVAGKAGDTSISIQHQSKTRQLNEGHLHAPVDPELTDLVMLVRPRKSRIYFQRTFFDYPLTLSGNTIRRLGIFQVAAMGCSYLMAKVFQRRPEKSLEDFFINRFGSRLYRTFFKSYTEKVWGVPCDQISAAWGAQRIKGLSLRSAVTHFFSKLFTRKAATDDIRQKASETSLIERFLYPKYGPGQMWEHVADLVNQEGGEVRLRWKVTGLEVEIDDDGKERIHAVEAISPEGVKERLPADYVFSTMPVRELLSSIQAPIPTEIKAIADGLMYRDFITVGLLVDRLLITESDGSLIQDTWIYIQEPDVLLGRLQIFNNWSPYLVADPTKVWLGLEYFCNDTDPIWKKSDSDIIAFAKEEIQRIGILNADEVRDAC
ncbi:MAG: NAD(P)/FAD-dependent oxidoreductase, partial [Janthinobacterium lividum]